MMTPKQKWMMAGLVPVCLAVWVPQFLNTGQTSGQVSIDGDMDAEFMPDDSMTGDVGSGDASYGGLSNTSGGGRAASASGGTSEALAGRSESSGLSDRSRGLLVADVLKTLGASEAFRVPGSRSDAVVNGLLPGESTALEGSGVEPELVSPMVSFVEEHPLRGTMAGETVRFAVFGSYRVAEGDLLPGTGAKVMEIKRTGVVIQEAGMSLEVTLPPLQTHPMSAPTQAGDAGVPDLSDPQAMLDNIASASSSDAFSDGQ